MRIKYLIITFVISILISSCGKSPDIMYINGKIHTLDENNNVVEAIAVRNGKIMDIGTSKEITDKYSADKVINLENKTVIPGLIDCDGSLIEFSKRLYFTAYLNNVRSLEELKSKIKEKAKELKSGEWVVFYNLNLNNIPDSELEKINKKTVDEVSGNVNIVIVDSLRLFSICNTKGLESLQITKFTPFPNKGEIQKDDSGELTGLFFDEAQKVLYEKIPEPEAKEIFDAVEKGSKELLKYGITEVQDRSIGVGAIDLLKQLIDSNKLPIKVYGVLTGDDEASNEYTKKGIIENYKDKLSIRSVCLDYDGAFEYQDAVMKSPYKVDPKIKQPYIDESTLTRIFDNAIEKNYQFRIKVVGDKGFSDIVSFLEKNIKNKNLKDHRIVLECVEFTNPSDINRIKGLDIIISIRPETIIDDLDIVPNLITEDNLKNTALWKSILQNSGRIIVGSGFPYDNQINPFIQMYFLIMRSNIESSTKAIPNQDQKLTILEALKSYTLWAAYSSFEEKIKGSLEKGKNANMVVLSDDIFTQNPDILLKTKVLKTIIDGIVIYDNTK